MKAARKLMLKDANIDSVPQERTVPSFLSHSSFSPISSPNHKSPQTAHSQVESDLPVRKQLFSLDPTASCSPSLSRFKYSSSKNPTPAKVGGQSPFRLLDHCQNFVSETESETNRCFWLSKEVVTSRSGESSALSQSDCGVDLAIVEKEEAGSLSLQEDHTCAQTRTAVSCEGTGSSFSYLTSDDLITTHPSSRVESSVENQLSASQTSCSDAEQTLSQSRVSLGASAPLVDLTENVPLNSHRTSLLPSTSSNTAKVWCIL